MGDAENRTVVRPSIVLTLAIPLVYLIVFGACLHREGDSDWDQMLSFHELSLWNFELTGIEKQWNPLMRGGMSLAGDPQVPLFSPSMILARVIDPAAAIKISCLLFLAVGFLGAWLLARRFGFAPGTAALAGALFAGNGFILSRFSHGHIVFLGTLGLPLWMWAARRCIPAPGKGPSTGLRPLLWFVLAGGVFFALSTDGAPITTLLLLVWVGLDAVVLSWQESTLYPIAFVAGSLVVGVALDAIYYLPMAANALLFPRWRGGVFVDPLVFFWFLVLPVRGKLLPAPANGHEFSVYVGPVLAYLLVRYRRDVFRAFPKQERRRMVIGSTAAFVIGLGAWRALARWLPPGPFDLLHRLPGFEAIGIPARFWGFLALPLALASAVAIRSLEREESSSGWKRRAIWAALFVFTLGFQAVAIVSPFVNPIGRKIVANTRAPLQIRTIENVPGINRSQAARLKPDVDLMEAYNAHDYLQGEIVPGSRVVLESRSRERAGIPVVAAWNGWSQIRLVLPAGASAGSLIVFNENFHPRWTASEGFVTRNRAGNLCLKLGAGAPPGGFVELDFHDGASTLGRRVSWLTLFIVLAGALVLAASHTTLGRRFPAVVRSA